MKKPRVENAAEKVLAKAIDQVSTKHEDHGDTVDSFNMVAELWSVYLNHIGKLRPEGIMPHDVTQLLVLLKLARSTYGKTLEDHFVDEAGYSALSALLAPLMEGKDA